MFVTNRPPSRSILIVIVAVPNDAFFQADYNGPDVADKSRTKACTGASGERRDVFYLDTGPETLSKALCPGFSARQQRQEFIVSGLEKAIRNALENGERENANQRARIYQSARQALESGLARQNITDPKMVKAQRRRLDDVITGIEKEEAERARQSKAHQAPRSPVFDDPFAVGRTPHKTVSEDQNSAPETPDIFADMPQPDSEPRRSAPQFDELSVDTAPENVDFRQETDLQPTVQQNDFTEADFSPEPEGRHPDGREQTFSTMDDFAFSDDRRIPSGKPKKSKRAEKKARSKAETHGGPKRKRGSGALATLITIVIFCVVLAAGGWWFMRSGFLPTPGNNSAAVSERVAAEDFEGASKWTPIFTPKSAGGLTPGPQARMESVVVDGVPAMRIRSSATGDAGAVVITLPPTVTRMLADGPVLIEATVLAPNGAAQPVGIYCADGTMEGCQRHRFSAPAHKDNLVVRLEPNGGTTPSRLLISSDLDGGGEPLDIFAIRAQRAR